jgi:hypothetical protein
MTTNVDDISSTQESNLVSYVFYKKRDLSTACSFNNDNNQNSSTNNQKITWNFIKLYFRKFKRKLQFIQQECRSLSKEILKKMTVAELRSICAKENIK